MTVPIEFRFTGETDSRDSVFAVWGEQMMVAGNQAHFRRIEMHVQPKPRWMPEALWRRICGRVIEVRELPF